MTIVRNFYFGKQLRVPVYEYNFAPFKLDHQDFLVFLVRKISHRLSL